MQFVPFFLSLAAIGYVYSTTLFQHLWTADAGDLLTAAYLGQLAHPPGYPLYLLFVKLFSFFSAGSLIRGAGIASLVFSLGALFFLHKTYILFSPRSRAIALIALLATAVLPLWWLYSVVQEVFMTSVFFIVLFNYLALRIYFVKKSGIFWWSALIATISLGLFHQYMLVLAYVSACIFFTVRCVNFKKFKLSRNFVFFFLLLGIGFIPYLFFISAQITGPTLWYPVKNVENLLFILLRKTYGTFNLFGGSFFQHSEFSLSTLREYFYVLARSFSVLGVLAVIGVVTSISSKKLYRVSLFLLLQGIFLGPFLVTVFPINFSNMLTYAIFERFVLLSFPALSVFLFLGIVRAYAFFNEVGKNKQWVGVAAILVFILAPTMLLSKYYPYFKTLSTDATIETLGINVLSYLPKNVVFMTAGDVTLFPVQYQYYAQRVRPDVTVISARIFLDSRSYQANKSYLKLKGLKVSDRGNSLEKFIEQNNTRFSFFSNFSFDGSDLFLQLGPVYAYRGNKERYEVDYSVATTFFKGVKSTNYRQKGFILPYGVLEARRYFVKTAHFFAQHYIDKNEAPRVDTRGILVNGGAEILPKQEHSSPTLQSGSPAKEDDYQKAIRFLAQSFRLEPDKKIIFSIGALYYKLGDCKNARTAWEDGFNYFADPELARRLSQLEAACFKNLNKARHWNFIYQDSKQYKGQ